MEAEFFSHAELESIWIWPLKHAIAPGQDSSPVADLSFFFFLLLSSAVWLQQTCSECLEMLVTIYRVFLLNLEQIRRRDKKQYLCLSPWTSKTDLFENGSCDKEASLRQFAERSTDREMVKNVRLQQALLKFFFLIPPTQRKPSHLAEHDVIMGFVPLHLSFYRKQNCAKNNMNITLQTAVLKLIVDPAFWYPKSCCTLQV